MTLLAPAARAARDTVYYPEENPRLRVRESTLHHRAGLDIYFMLHQRYRAEPDVFVAGNLYVYYEEGNPAAMVSPDVFVGFGVPDHERAVYKLWEEPAGPTVVFEVTSPTTRRKDRDFKPPLYARLGVAEYFLFDPAGDYLKPPLQGFRLTGGAFEPIPPDATGVLVSDRLGLRVFLDAWQIRLVDVRSGERLLTPLEEAEARQAVERRAEAERAAAEAGRAVAEAERAAAEAERAAAEAENARLRAELARLRRNGEAGE